MGDFENMNGLTGMTTVIDDIIKSPSDELTYRALRLENGLKVMLVSDPATDKAAAALDVNVGHLNDPWELPGLAHFCEHMLFLGSKAYPNEGEYDKFMGDHGGSSNAGTSLDHTSYYFNVGSKDLVPALDRFSQFFISPLFTESGLEREVKAVESEWRMYEADDYKRMDQVERSHSKATHVYSKFSVGNRDTLWTQPQKRGQNTRKELLKFYKIHYSANTMTLCIVGKESLNELTEIAIQRFKDLKSNGRGLYKWEDDPWGPKQLGQRIDIVSIKELRSMFMSFPIPDLHLHYRSKPSYYVSHLIGHEGPGSLLSELKHKSGFEGWGNSVSAGARAGGRGFAFFDINVDLSEAGLEHVEDILKLVFAYIALLRREGPQEWIHKECQQLNQIRFRFKVQEKEKAQDIAEDLSEALHDYPEREVLTGPYCMDEHRPDLIKLVMDKLRPENFTTIVMSHKYKGSPELKTEKWYGTKFLTEKMSKKLLSDLREASKNGDPAFRNPLPNVFIPDDFSIKSKSIPVKANEELGPEIIMDDPRTRLWHKLDREFNRPKAYIELHLATPLACLTPADENMSLMLTDLLNDQLTEYSYDASLAGLFYFVFAHNGFYLSVSGYSQKQRILLTEIVKGLTKPKLDPERFAIIKERYLRYLRNSKLEEPYEQAKEYAGLLLAQRGWDKDQRLQSAEVDLTLENLEEFLPRLLSSLHIEGLFYGNVTESEAKDAVGDVWRILDAHRPVRPLPSSLLTRDHAIQIPPGTFVLFEADNPVHENSAVVMVLQIGLDTTRNNALVDLVQQLLDVPFFDRLRTKESLGYVVAVQTILCDGVLSIRCLVQGEKDPAFVQVRVEVFLQEMRQEIQEMKEDEFEKAKDAMATKKLEKPKTIGDEASRFWNEITSHNYAFNRQEEEVAELRKLGKGHVLEFWDKHLALDSPERRKLVCAVLSPAVRKAHADLDKDPAYQASLAQLHTKLPLAERVRDMTAWKMYQSTFGIPVPAKSVPPIGLPEPPKTQT